MCDEIMLSYPYFYHVTKCDNLDSIKTWGLQPRLYPYNEYSECAPYKLAQICFSPEHKLSEHIASLWEKHDQTRLIVFKIKSEDLINKRTGLDWTFQETVYLPEGSVCEKFKMSIDFLGTICCFETIPFSQLEIHSYYPLDNL